MSKKYSIIYADPPWAYKSERPSHEAKPQDNRGGATKHYSTMTIDEICTLPVQDIAADDCILFMWGTWPKLFEAEKLIRAWGFEYKTCAFVWVKTNKNANVDQSSFFPADSFDTFMGMGRWTRSNAEFCLLATRGEPKRVDCGVHQIIYAPIGRHSKKPDETRDRIVKLVGELPRVEMFARQPAEGWDVWGNEVECDVSMPCAGSKI